MKAVLIWDLPTRLFHGLLVMACFSAFALAESGATHHKEDDD